MRKLSVLLGLLAGIAVALQAPGNGAAEAVAEAVATSMVDFDGDCIVCGHLDCPRRQHYAREPREGDRANWSRNGGAHYSKRCFGGRCQSMHWPRCSYDDGSSIAMVDMDQLRGSIEAKDAQSVKDLLADHTESTALNVERSAVQVMDCDGTVIAHFPVGEKLLDQVSAE